MPPSILQRLQDSARGEVRHRIWIMSDLQQEQPDNARYCLTTATEDFRALELACDQIWYLGDAVEGTDHDRLRAMVDMQVELLEPLKIPLRFVCGNHDFDPYLCNRDGLPLSTDSCLHVSAYDRFSQVPGWRTAGQISDFYFTDSLGEFSLFFFSDHAHPQGEWISTHGGFTGNAEAYPHTPDDYLAVRDLIEKAPGPVITAGHLSYPGGLRPSTLMGQLLPLPENVRVHFYGHSHIGDSACGGPAGYRKISTVDNQNIPQIDVAALENIRGDAIRSAVLEIYADGSLGILFREHCRQRWCEAYYLNGPRA